MSRCYYQASISDFINSTDDAIRGILTKNAGDIIQEQNYAWDEEIRIMKHTLNDYREEHGHIIFEYSIPRLGKRIDVVVLLRCAIFVIEFKVGKNNFTKQDQVQVMDYALDLKYFHEESLNLTIVPILIATETDKKHSNYQPIPNCISNDLLLYNTITENLYNTITGNSEQLNEIINRIISNLPDCDTAWTTNWVNSRYSPTPTIIEAASALYHNHSVEDITRSESDIEETTKSVLDIIRKTKERREKSICFVTGVPGAGKTLVGLNVAIQQSECLPSGERNHAVYLSGNGPLVEVLTEALARNKVERDKERGYASSKVDAKREVSQFIQLIHRYRKNMLDKIKLPIQNGTVEIDTTKVNEHPNDGYAEVEHVAIFDEAQRCWDLKHISNWLAKGGSRGNLKKIANFPMSEAEFLIWSLNLRKDWAVIVCLVGGGQEINTGEAGIGEWIRAISEHFSEWKMYLSNHLTDKEYAEGNISNLISNKPNIFLQDHLHLATSMRSIRAENLSRFVHELLDWNIDIAKNIYAEIPAEYPIYLTRDIRKAKDWLKSKACGSQRYGIVASSKAKRLKPLALNVDNPNFNNIRWFLNDDSDVLSSNFLEDIATEFNIQGLELDWTCVVWDADFRANVKNKCWEYYTFSSRSTSCRWTNEVNDKTKQAYMKNAYRVLMTRARMGMIICIPEGNREDNTRKPEFYDGTYQYFKFIGLKEI